MIDAVLTAMAQQDADAVLARFSAEATYVLGIDPAICGYGGEYSGASAIRLLLRQMHADWQVLAWQAGPVTRREGVLHVGVRWHLVHLASGSDLIDRRRYRFTLARRKIALAVETVDEDRMRAFLAYARWLVRSGGGLSDAEL